MPEIPKYSIGDLVSMLGGLYSVEQLRRLAKAGKIPGALKRPGKHLRFHDSDGELSRWIRETRRRRLTNRSRKTSIPLDRDTNKLVNGAYAYKSGYVRLDEPVSELLLRSTRPSQNLFIPTWRDIAVGPHGTVKSYVATSDRGWRFEVAKVAEAMVAADINGYGDLFMREVRRAYSIGGIYAHGVIDQNASASASETMSR